MNAINRTFVFAIVAVVLTACGGNGGSPSRAQQQADTTPPVISLAGDNPQVLSFNEPYTELGATASDNRDGDLTAAIVIDASAVDTATPGDYVVTYNVTDAAGNAAVTMTRTVTVLPPVPEPAAVSIEGDIKKLIFSWDEVQYAEYYRLLENPDGHSGFTQVGEDVPADTLTVTQDIAVHLRDWPNALYIVEACNSVGCAGSSETSATDLMLNTIGYFKASNIQTGDVFSSVAISANGNTVAVGARGEDSIAPGINGNENDNSADASGAVYVFHSDHSGWHQQAYIKASNPDSRDYFGVSISMSADGNKLAVGAWGEDSAATGINGDQSDNTSEDSGAVYLFRLENDNWVQEAYIKGSNTEAGDRFSTVVLSADGSTLAVGARAEDSSAKGVNGDQFNDDLEDSGAVYVFRFDGSDWSQQAYIKDSTDRDDCGGYRTNYQHRGIYFGLDLDLSSDGDTLVVGDFCSNGLEEFGAAQVYRFDEGNWSFETFFSGSIGFGNAVAIAANGRVIAVGAPGEIPDESYKGKVWVYRCDGEDWTEESLIQPANTFPSFVSERFGIDVALDGDGDHLLVGSREHGGATGINGDEYDLSAEKSGAAFIFRYGGSSWSQQAYVKATNTDADDYFAGASSSVAMSADGGTLAIGAPYEDGAATGINGEATDNSAISAGAVYVY